jgi:hypothetical protein
MHVSRGLEACNLSNLVAPLRKFLLMRPSRKFAPWLLGSKVIVRSDHSNLQWPRQHPQQYGKLSRWLSFLSLFDMQSPHCNFG